MFSITLADPFLPILFKGPQGLPGRKGEQGRSCEAQAQYYSGTLVVRHSQTTVPPRCERGHAALWEGYSLLYIEGNEKAHHQDLGNYYVYMILVIFDIIEIEAKISNEQTLHVFNRVITLIFSNRIGRFMCKKIQHHAVYVL